MKLPLDEWTLLRGMRLADGRYAPDEECVLLERACGHWPDDGYFILELTGENSSLLLTEYRFFDSDSESPAFRITQKLFPNRRVKGSFPLRALDGHSTFIMPEPGQLKSGAHGLPTRASAMRRLQLCVWRGKDLRALALHACALELTLPEMTVRGKPLFDSMGQVIERDWPGKMASQADLTAALRTQRASAQAEGSYPEGFSRWGGWLEKRFEATGFFHTAREGRRWWLADPDGYAFLSNGACYANRLGVYSMVHGMAELCESLPDREDPLYRRAYWTVDQDPEFVKRNGPEAGRDRWQFNFPRANLMRAFGQDWWNAWVDINAARMRRWGLNTIGVGVANYPDEDCAAYLRRAGIPYVYTLLRFPLTSPCVYRDFPDVFSPEYAAGCAAFAQQTAPFRSDPLLIGYFITNEPEWLFQNDAVLSEQLLKNPAQLASKRAFVEWLRARHGRIDALNAAWGTAHPSFEALLTPPAAQARFEGQALRDMEAFDAVLVREYNRVPAEALRRADPNHLLLGMRMARFHARAAHGSEVFDVLSFNRYARLPTEQVEEAAAMTDMPILIGEWHVSAFDRGTYGSGLLEAENQEERGKAMAQYVEQGFAHSHLVGMHYFEYNDQPPLGRFDGATGSSGLIDVCCQPYAECIAHYARANARAYAVKSGSIPPYEAQWRAAERRAY